MHCAVQGKDWEAYHCADLLSHAQLIQLSEYVTAQSTAAVAASASSDANAAPTHTGSQQSVGADYTAKQWQALAECMQAVVANRENFVQQQQGQQQQQQQQQQPPPPLR
jgi:hypothetical protein